MGSHREPLPDFERPPVVEVVLGVQFVSPASFATTHLGLLWSRFRDSFPRVEQHPSTPTAIEPTASRSRSGIRIEFPELLIPRCWFIAQDGGQLIQVQPGLFTHNWRKTAASPEYPRYPVLREQFRSELCQLDEFLGAEGLGSLTITHCEVTYVNHIRSEQGTVWSGHGEASRVFKLIGSPGAFRYLPGVSSCGFRADYRMAMDDGEGGLAVTMSPGFVASTGDPMFNLTLSAQGSPNGPDVDSAMTMLDQGREWVVRGFADLTTDPMHQHWGRLDRVDS